MIHFWILILIQFIVGWFWHFCIHALCVSICLLRHKSPPVTRKNTESLWIVSVILFKSIMISSNSALPTSDYDVIVAFPCSLVPRERYCKPRRTRKCGILEIGNSKFKVFLTPISRTERCQWSPQRLYRHCTREISLDYNRSWRKL